MEGSRGGGREHRRDSAWWPFAARRNPDGPRERSDIAYRCTLVTDFGTEHRWPYLLHLENGNLFLEKDFQ